MEIAVVSHPYWVPHELRFVNALFEEGLMQFHLRKPHWTEAQVDAYIRQIPPKFRDRIAIHEHHNLKKYGLGFIHFDQAPSHKHDKMRWLCGKTTLLHYVEHLTALDYRFDYVFLTPVFEHIERHSLRLFFPEEMLIQTLTKDRPYAVFAAGGINLRRAAYAQTLGFDGVVLMEDLWRVFLGQGHYQALTHFNNYQRLGRPSSSLFVPRSR